MPKIRKFVIGIKPLRRMFRLRGKAGVVADHIIAALDQDPSAQNFTHVRRQAGDDLMVISDEDRTISLTLNIDTVIFARDYYDNHKHCDIDKEIKLFNKLFGLMNGELKMNNIRRIGIYAEYRFEPQSKNPSEDLLSKIAKIDRKGYPAKFNLQFETRTKVSGSGPIDSESDAFLNVIENYYDSELDTEHSDKNRINANIDVQKYFAPVLTNNIEGEVSKLRNEFERASTEFITRLKNLGFNDGAW